MKDDNGRVTIAGWYDEVEPLGELERQAINEAPKYDQELKKQLDSHEQKAQAER